MYRSTSTTGAARCTLDHDVIDSNADAAGWYAAGAIYAYGYYGAETVEMTGTELKGNLGSGKESMGGVGLYTYYASVSLTATGCQFLDNRAPDKGWGGGVGLYDDDDSEAHAQPHPRRDPGQRVGLLERRRGG